MKTPGKTFELKDIRTLSVKQIDTICVAVVWVMLLIWYIAR